MGLDFKALFEGLHSEFKKGKEDLTVIDMAEVSPEIIEDLDDNLEG